MTAMLPDPGDRTLVGVELLRGLPPEESRALARRCTWKRFRAGQHIITVNDRGTDVYFVIGGRLRATIYSQSGKEVAFRDMGAGRTFGDLSAIDGRPRSANVVALEDSLVVAMPAEVFNEVLLNHPRICAEVLRDLASLVRRLTERVVEFSTLGVRNRVHAEVLRLARDHLSADNTAEIRPAPTHAEIASRVSTHREAVTRTLNRLAREGVIDRRRGVIIVRDVERLECMVEDVQS